MVCVNASAKAVACLKHGHEQAGGGKFARRHQRGNAAADDEHVRCVGHKLAAGTPECTKATASSSSSCTSSGEEASA